ncbi:SRPBCC domain-containing protein [Kribbella sp. NPDC050124]|uniref:SRPBCC domain-containing protein n=1 Tax=Kribbella sp. NPDC050124 TaxID=3364114 RepID=UPI0037A64C54
MADMHHLVAVEKADAAAAYSALTTQDGITAWWTSRADVPGAAVGDMLKMSFPDAPITWDMRIEQVDEPLRLEWLCAGGPPGWETTRVRWDVEANETGVVVRLDHEGFAAVDDMFRIVTVGWAQMLLSLKAYLETGVRKPFFNF